MKKLVLAVIFSCISTPIYAEKWQDKCESIAGFAEQIMRNRQIGVPMSKMMKVSSGAFSGMIVAAFDSPRYSTKEYQSRSISDFRDKAYLVCAKQNINKDKD